MNLESFSVNFILMRKSPKHSFFSLKDLREGGVVNALFSTKRDYLDFSSKDTNSFKQLPEKKHYTMFVLS